MEDTQVGNVIENSIEIFRSGGEILQRNQVRAQKANEIGQKIIEDIKANGGRLNPELDQRCERYLANCSNALSEMNESRKPVTQIMDAIKSEFTKAEKILDSKNSEAAAYLIQKFRNDYARQLHEEEERKRKEAEEKAKKEQEANSLKAEAEKRIYLHFSNYLTKSKNRLYESYTNMRLDSYDGVRASIMGYEAVYPHSHFAEFRHMLSARYHSQEEIETIVKFHTEGKFSEYAASYKEQISELKTDLLTKLPSKKAELERIEAANAEERQRLEAEKKQRDEAEQKRLREEAEARKKEEEAKIEMNKQAADTATLFDQTAATAGTSLAMPNTRQDYEIEVLHPAGYVLIFQHWFDNEGKNLAMDKIGKTSLDQMKAWCEKKAHKEGTKIENAFLNYKPTYKAVNSKKKS